MTRTYQIGKDQIICKTEQYETEYCTNYEQVQYLYREPVYEKISKTKYTIIIRLYGNTYCGEFETTDKNKANNYFKTILEYLKADNGIK